MGTRQGALGVDRISRLALGSDFPAVRRKRPYDDHVQRNEDDGPHRVVGQPQEVRKRYQGRQDDTDDPSPQGPPSSAMPASKTITPRIR